MPRQLFDQVEAAETTLKHLKEIHAENRIALAQVVLRAMEVVFGDRSTIEQDIAKHKHQLPLGDRFMTVIRVSEAMTGVKIPQGIIDEKFVSHEDDDPRKRIKGTTRHVIDVAIALNDRGQVDTHDLNGPAEKVLLIISACHDITPDEIALWDRLGEEWETILDSLRRYMNRTLNLPGIGPESTVNELILAVTAEVETPVNA